MLAYQQKGIFRTEIKGSSQKALVYIESTGCLLSIESFDEDHEPIGKELRKELVNKRYIYYYEGLIVMDETIRFEEDRS